ncbi:MAG: thiamine-phosphate kinase [Planctomycetota bacterium]
MIRRFRARAPKHPWLKVGPGHDCAVLDWPGRRGLAFKIDQVVEGTHFVLRGREAATPFQVGWKAMAKACSDVAAAGYWPVAATAAVNLRRGTDEKLALQVYEGLIACCKRFSFALAGGDVSTSRNGLSVAVSLLGEGPKGGAWLRCGARPGDALLATGSLGGSLASGKHLRFLPRLEEARLVRSRCGTAVHACIDISDGLSRDLHHICAESRCGAVIFEEFLPLERAASLDMALSDGEDFELLLAVEPKAAARLLSHWRHDTPLSRIGFIRPRKQGCVLVSRGGGRSALRDVGYEHRV